ncbi:MAG: Tm-1-like ATP-binding domain-containing protein [Planctomycetota bacterium]|nr:Tm-1-like ATP-binding domain-containing protein [Planctomycetota bacterium]
MSVYLLGTLDTKGHEAAFVADAIRSLGLEVRIVDTGCIGQAIGIADVSREQVFAAAGTSLAEMAAQGDRGVAVAAAAGGARNLLVELHGRGEVSGVLALGGSAGTTIGTSAMRALPLGVPKVMVSTLASGQTRPYVGGKDIMMLNSVVDIAGINRISRTVLHQAAAAIVGMIKFQPAELALATDRPLIAATMFGVTTPCVLRAQRILEAAGYEVLVFHATGSGGEAMEGLIADGLFAGVLDITTTEIADELVGGTLSAGPDRLTAAACGGVPQVVSVGATDMVNFGPLATVPPEFRHRKFHVHNPTVTLMRTTANENRMIGEDIARKVSGSTAPFRVLLPRGGVSAIDQVGQPFDDPQTRTALFDAIRGDVSADAIIESDHHINDEEFADLAAATLLSLLRG